MSPCKGHAEVELDSQIELVRLEDIYDDLEIFATTLTIVDSHYVDETVPKKLIYGALKGLLASLDPYSQFLTPDSHKEIQIETEGKFGGIGVEISVKDDVLTVISPISRTPAAKAGLKPGDRIAKIDSVSTRGMSLDSCVKLLRGKPGSIVNLTIVREEEGRMLEISITRDIVKVESLEYATFISKGIGYIRISEFQEQTPADFEKELINLEQGGLQGLIIDLRNNPGGLFPEAIKVAELFVPQGQLIVSTRGRLIDQNAEFISKGPIEKKAYPIIILINKGSASASEVMAGALQDHQLAVILGEQSFGKGSVQTVVPMRDGSALRLTTSKYYTPNGTAIHGIGLVPDVVVKYQNLSEIEANKQQVNKSKPVQDFFKKFDAAESDEFPDKELMELIAADNQVQRAMDLIQGLKVYSTKSSIAE